MFWKHLVTSRNIAMIFLLITALLREVRFDSTVLFSCPLACPSVSAAAVCLVSPHPHSVWGSHRPSDLGLPQLFHIGRKINVGLGACILNHIQVSRIGDKASSAAQLPPVRVFYSPNCHGDLRSLKNEFSRSSKHV